MKTIAEYKQQILETKAKVFEFEINFNTHIAPLLDGLLTNHFFIYPADNLIVTSVKTREQFLTTKFSWQCSNTLPCP